MTKIKNIIKQANGYILVYLHNVILLSNENMSDKHNMQHGYNIKTCNNMDEYQKYYAEYQKPDTEKHMLYNSIESIMTESR